MSEPISVMGALIVAHRLLFKLGCDPKILGVSMSPIIGERMLKIHIKHEYFEYLARTYRLPITTQKSEWQTIKTVEFNGVILTAVVSYEEAVQTTVETLPPFDMEM